MCPKIYGECGVFYEYHSTYPNFSDIFESLKKVLALYILIYSRVICFYKLRKIR